MLCRSSLALFIALLVTGCASTERRQPTGRSFVFERDTFAFANELLWEYEVNEATGERTTRTREPKPDYHHYCFPMTRAARQFYDFAEFKPQLDRTNIVAAVDLIDAVLKQNPRADPQGVKPIVIPGYTGLRELSQDYEANLKRAIGGNWQSWVQRGNWRMVLPFSRANQARAADELKDAIESGRVPVVHLSRFPALTINHAVLLFAVESNVEEISFHAYDPNTSGQPLTLKFNKADRTFYLSATPYWQGGRVDVYEVFKNSIY